MQSKPVIQTTPAKLIQQALEALPGAKAPEHEGARQVETDAQKRKSKLRRKMEKTSRKKNR